MHEQKGVRLDVEDMSSVVSPRTRVIMDDIQSSPGQTLRRLVSAGHLKLLEVYGPFAKRTRSNPCQRYPVGMHGPCQPWGFAIVRYAFDEERALLPKTSGKRVRGPCGRAMEMLPTYNHNTSAVLRR